MKPSRPYRIVTALLALVSILFMQLAMASYVCPGSILWSAGAVTARPMSGMDEAGMPNCDGMDKRQSGLCHATAHGQSAKQSLDKPELPLIPPFAPVALVRELIVNEGITRPLTLSTDGPLLARTAAPPIAIRNCCFRI